MPQYTSLQFEKLSELFSSYGVGTANKCTPLEGGLANTNVKIETADKAFLLKICDEKTLPELELQVCALIQLASNGFPTTRPYPLKDGTGHVLVDGDLRCLLFDFLPGEPGSIEAMTVGRASELGRAVARLHQVPLPEPFEVSRPPFPPGLVGIDAFLQELVGADLERHVFVQRYLKGMIPSLRSVVEDPKLHVGLVHGDIFPDNCMFDQDNLVAVFDFEEACVAPVALDIAMTLIGCCFDRTTYSIKCRLAVAFLDAYDSVRHIPDAEWGALQAFVKYAIIATAFWRFRQFNVRRPDDSLRDHWQGMTNYIDNASFDTFLQQNYADKLLSLQQMRYKSTRGGERGITFENALLTGYASDGGMIVPEYIPSLPIATILRWKNWSYIDIVKALLPIYIPANEIPRKELYHIIDDAFQHFSSPEVLPTKLLGDIIIVEMFHGDTGAFKDIAMSIIGRMMDYFLRKRQRQVTVVVGTSGDTGSAAIYGVKDSAQMDIIVYYPKGRISEMQELQMVTHLSSNVHVFACHGTSDDLDVPIKAVLNDTSFSAQHNLCSINSVNWARVCVQIAHFFHASFRALSAYGDLIPVDIYVPTGACGDLVGGMFAAAMGLPCKLFACVNENDIIHRWLLSGVFSVAPQVVQTVAPSMDIQVPYNVERMLWLASSFDQKATADIMTRFYDSGSVTIPDPIMNRLRGIVSSAAVTQSEIATTIKSFHNRNAYILDPHTAIGVHVAATTPTRPKAVLATATPAKFSETISSILGAPIEMPPNFQELRTKERHVVELSKTQDWQAELRQTIVNISNRRDAAK